MSCWACIVLLLIFIGRANAGKRARLMETVITRAGEAASLPCPGLSDSSDPSDFIVNQLTWTCTSARKSCPAANERGELAEFVARAVRVHGDRARIRVDRTNWSLLLSPVRADDGGEYSCAFNGQPAGSRTIRMLVLDVPSAPGRPMVVHHASRQVQLSWAPSLQTNNSPVQRYLIQTRRGETGTWPALEAAHQTSSNASSSSVTDLSPFTVYTFRVVAQNELGLSAPSESSYPVSTLRERPSAAPEPTGWRNVSSTSVEVRWKPPSNDTLHGEFVAFLVSWRRVEPPGPASVHQLHDFSARSYVIEKLEPYTEYLVTLQLRNPEDLGPSSSISTFTAEGVPSAPENLSLLEASDRNLTLTWRPPRRANGVLTGYQVSWATGRDAAQRRRLPDGDAQTYVLTGLEPATTYTVWLSAATSAGLGTRSDSARARTDVSGPGPPDVTNITCPSDSRLRLQWRRPLRVYGGVELYYVLYRLEEEWDFVERVVPVQSDQMEYSILLPNLTSGQIYEIRIQGATHSTLITGKIYKGQQSVPRKVRLERGCEEIQPFSTWQHRPRPASALSGSEVMAVFIAGVLLLLTLVAAAVWRRRRRYPALGRDKGSSAGAAPVAGWSAPAHDAVPAHLFSQHVQQLHMEDSGMLRREWEALQLRASLAEGAGTTQSAQKTNQNGLKNANGDAKDGFPAAPVPVPVRSKQYRGEAAPLVYAVDGYQRSRAFLVTTRPPPAAYDALWQLAWEQGVTSVVLVGSLTSYSDRFWPQLGGVRTSGHLHVESQTEATLAFCVVRTLTIYKHKSKPTAKRKERTIHFYQYTHWPEYGVPEYPLPLLDFVLCSSRAADSGSPSLVIAGQSSSSLGLYVGLVSLLTQLAQRHELAVFSYWHHVIGQCPYLMTSLEEYALLHTCLLERVTSGETSVPRHSSREYVAELHDGGHPSTAAERQYMSVVSLEPRQYTVVSAGQPYNEHKNRSLGFIPMESSRVSLTPKPSVEGSDYINASWLPGFRYAQEFIATQHPLRETVLDLWQMLWDNRASTVVCLSPEECSVFWPLEEEELDCESFLVRFLSGVSADGDAHDVRTFQLESTEGEEDLTVRLVLLSPWPRHLSSVQVMEVVQRVVLLHGDRRTPLVVMDRFGGTEAATFCLLCTVLRQLQYHARFDIFTYAKLYHQRRPGIWRSMEEFLALYHVVDGWISAAEEGGRSWSPPPAARVEARLSGVEGVIV